MQATPPLPPARVARSFLPRYQYELCSFFSNVLGGGPPEPLFLLDGALEVGALQWPLIRQTSPPGPGLVIHLQTASRASAEVVRSASKMVKRREGDWRTAACAPPASCRASDAARAVQVSLLSLTLPAVSFLRFPRLPEFDQPLRSSTPVLGCTSACTGCVQSPRCPLVSPLCPSPLDFLPQEPRSPLSFSSFHARERTARRAISSGVGADAGSL